MEENFNIILNDLKELLVNKNDKQEIKNIKTIIKNVKILQKQVIKATKPKKPHNSVNSGFTKPVLITNELADFLGLEHGSYLSRVETVRLIHHYIIDNNLQDQNDKRHIIVNGKLANLLKYDKDKHGELYYTVLQKLIQQHFIKNLSDTTFYD